MNHYYTTHFVDGLKCHICVVVAMHRPKNLDIACLLTKLQEELTDPAKQRELRRWENPLGARPYAPKALPFPPPPPRLALPPPDPKLAAEAVCGPTTEDR
jgi:hypothetical protein